MLSRLRDIAQRGPVPPVLGPSSWGGGTRGSERTGAVRGARERRPGGGFRAGASQWRLPRERGRAYFCPDTRTASSWMDMLLLT